PYVEIAFTLEGVAAITVGAETRRVEAGGVVVIPANAPHRFVNSGTGVLRQIDIHCSPKFIQTNLRRAVPRSLRLHAPDVEAGCCWRCFLLQLAPAQA